MKEICTLLVKLYIICSRMQRVNLHARPSIIQVGCPTYCYQVCALDHERGVLQTWITIQSPVVVMSWWSHQMETFSTLLDFCVGNSPVTGEFSSQRPVTRSFDVFFDLCQNKWFSKQWWGWWFETPSCSLWRHCNVNTCCARLFDTLFPWEAYQFVNDHY